MNESRRRYIEHLVAQINSLRLEALARPDSHRQWSELRRLLAETLMRPPAEEAAPVAPSIEFSFS